MPHALAPSPVELQLSLGAFATAIAHSATLSATPIAAAGVRNVDPAYKLRQNVRIAMLYLEDDDPISAEQVGSSHCKDSACCC